MASIFKRKYKVNVRGRQVTRLRSKFTIKWKDHGEHKSMPGYEDKSASEQLGLDIERLKTLRDTTEPMEPDLFERMSGLDDEKHAELVKHGLLKPRMAIVRKPLVEHVADYIADLEATGRDAEYTYIADRRLRKFVLDCQCKNLPDVTVEAFEQWRKARRSKLAARTLNQYLDTLRGFLKWCAEPGRGRLESNPLACVRPVDERGKMVRPRRALTLDEVDRLIAAAKGTKGVRRTRQKTDRALFYKITFYCLLRRGDVEALRWGDLVLDVLNPYMVTRAESCKGKREDRIPIRRDLADELLSVRPKQAKPSDPVFSYVPGIKQFRADLRAAGVLYVDELGRRADFHAFGRKTPGTVLAVDAKVSPAVHRKMMRHVDIRTTHQYYVDSDALQMQAVAECMPEIGKGQHIKADAESMAPPVAPRKGLAAG